MVYLAAWVPYLHGNDESAALAIAVAWVARQQAVRGEPVALLVNGTGEELTDPLLHRFVRWVPVTHPNRQTSLIGPASPLLAYLPSRRELHGVDDQAARTGSPVCVVEDPAQPAGDWAARVGAVDLLSPEH